MDMAHLVLHRAISMQRCATTRAASGLPSARALCHIEELRPVKRADKPSELFGEEIALLDEDRGAALRQELAFALW